LQVQVLASTPLLEELTLSGCLRLSCGVLVTASLPPGAPAGNGAVAGPYDALNGGMGAAAGQGPAFGGIGIGDGQQAQEHWHWIDDAAAGGEGGAAGGEGAPQQLRFPLQGLALPRVSRAVRRRLHRAATLSLPNLVCAPPVLCFF
jgi:hypothetical protein